MKKVLFLLLTVLALCSVFSLTALAETDVAVVSSYEDMTAFVRAGLIAREESIRFRYEGTDCGAPTLDDLCAYGAEPAGGDYLRLSFNGGFPSVTQDGDGTYTVSASFYTDAAQEAAVDAYIADVVSACTQTTEGGKARYIYDYLCDNVLFDLENLYNEEELLKFTAYGAAAEGRAVCQGFSQLYYRLAIAAGLDCRIVTGTRAGERHAWNIVRNGDSWYHVDVSCGSQLFNNAGYFLQPTLNNYAIYYNGYTSPEIRDYFFSGSGNTSVRTGTLGYKISWSLDIATGELEICGLGAMPDMLYDNSSPFYNNRNIRSVVISDGITNISDYLFYGCSNLASLTLSADVASIGKMAVYPSQNLERISVNENNSNFHVQDGCLIESNGTIVLATRAAELPTDGSVRQIGAYTFYNRTDLTELHLPDSVSYCGDFAFAGCSGITSLTIPDSFQIIAQGVFSGCTGISSVTIPENVKYIYNLAFSGCTGLTSIHIPKEVRECSTAFVGCSGLESITVDAENPYYYAENNCLIERAHRKVCAGCFNSVIPDDGYVESIDYSFSNCERMTGITIPESVKNIWESFSECVGLTEIVFPTSMNMIKDSFFDCTGLTSITLPMNAAQVSGFNGCSSLTSLTVPGGVEKIRGFSNCENLESVVLENGVLSFNAFTNKMMDAFCDNEKLRSVVLPESFGAINARCFMNCPALETVKILNSNMTIANDCFSDHDELTVLGFAGSTAETFAYERQFRFVALCPVTNEPHTLTAYEATEATCTDSAYAAGEFCADCGEWISGHEQTAEALGHAPADPVWENVTSPTCTEEGSYDSVIRCTRCGEVLSSIPGSLAAVPHADGDRDGYCDDCGAYICTHDETELKNQKAASCTENGYSGDIVCGVCGATLEYGVTVYAPGHTPALSLPAVPATCLRQGRTAQYTCSVCGAVTTEARQTPVSGHTDVGGDGLCDLCLAPMGCTLYGECGENAFWYIRNETLVISGVGTVVTDNGACPWASYAGTFDCAYIKEGITAADGAAFNVCPLLKRIFAPADTAVTGCEKPVLSYTFTDGVADIAARASAPEMDVYDILNTAYVFCIDRTVASLRFGTLRLNGSDGREYTEYDILRGGKLVSETHYRLPAGAGVSDFLVRPLGYASFNQVLSVLGEHPDRNLILSILCDDLLTDAQKTEADAYTEQIVVRFVDDPVPGPEGEGGQSGDSSFLDRFYATLAAILALFKKVFKFFKDLL